MKIQQLILLLVLVSSAYSQTTALLLNNKLVFQKFYQFQLTFDIKYESPQVEAYRLKIFQQNLQLIQGKEGYGITRFMDLTSEEFAQKYLTLKAPKDYNDLPDLDQGISLDDGQDQTINTSPNATLTADTVKLAANTVDTAKLATTTVATVSDAKLDVNTATSVVDVAAASKIFGWPFVPFVPSVDWKAQGKVTSVKNQGGCGSCWAFSAIAAVESAYKIQNSWYNNPDPDLSEQELVSCSWGYGNYGCSGGWMNSAFQYIKDKAVGVEQQFPYTASNSPCKATNIRHLLKSYVTIPQNNCLSMLQALQQRPLSVAVDASGWQFYNGNSNPVFNCNTSNLNHGVLLVGYVKQNNRWTYKIKNSWGTSWGISGYIYLDAINTPFPSIPWLGSLKNSCGICKVASYPII